MNIVEYLNLIIDFYYYYLEIISSYLLFKKSLE